MQLVMASKNVNKYISVILAAIFSALVTSSIPLFSAKPACSTSSGQTVVKWKSMYWFPCKYLWNGICLWPLQRRHSTYKVTVSEGIPLHDENGKAIPIASGVKKKWVIYDSTEWNAFENHPAVKRKFPDYERIADNEFVVVVETRYKLFHDVESTLRICTQEH